MTLSILLRMDILGFTKMMESPEADTIMDKLETIVGSHYDRIRWMPKDLKPELKIHPMYGDTFDIYYKCGENDAILMSLIDIANDFIRDLVDNRMLVRGAIVKGDLRDTNCVFTGKAMASAHRKESECCFPSVIMDEGIVALVREQLYLLYGPDLAKEEEKKYLFEYDGKNYLDYIKRDKELLHKTKTVIDYYREKAEAKDLKKCTDFDNSLCYYETQRKM